MSPCSDIGALSCEIKGNFQQEKRDDVYKKIQNFRQYVSNYRKKYVYNNSIDLKTVTYHARDM